MTATNHTKNYNLSQFTGTDRPTWLGDYNGDMSKIDAQLKRNADDIASAIPDVSDLVTSSDLASGLAGKVDKTASQPGTLGLTASELDSMYKDANGIVRVGHTAE